jgi:hypothetical protein
MAVCRRPSRVAADRWHGPIVAEAVVERRPAGAIGDTAAMPESSARPRASGSATCTLADADMIDAWDARRSPFNDFGMPSEPIDPRRLGRGPLRNERNGHAHRRALEDGRPIGPVGWHVERYGPNPESAAFNVGIELIPEARGQGYGTEAQAPARRLPVRDDRSPSGRGRDRTSRTSPSSGRSRRPASGARASCAGASSVRVVSRPRVLRGAPDEVRHLGDDGTSGPDRQADTSGCYGWREWIASTGRPSTRPPTWSPTSPVST